MSGALRERIIEAVAARPDSSSNAVVFQVGGRRGDVLDELRQMAACGLLVAREGARRAITLSPAPDSLTGTHEVELVPTSGWRGS